METLMTAGEREILSVLVRVMDQVAIDPEETKASLREFIEEVSYLLMRTLTMRDEVRATSYKRRREYWTRRHLEQIWESSKDKGEETSS
jgi:hypothetical protein